METFQVKYSSPASSPTYIRYSMPDQCSEQIYQNCQSAPLSEIQGDIYENYPLASSENQGEIYQNLPLNESVGGGNPQIRIIDIRQELNQNGGEESDELASKKKPKSCYIELSLAVFLLIILTLLGLYFWNYFGTDKVVNLFKSEQDHEIGNTNSTDVKLETASGTSVTIIWESPKEINPKLLSITTNSERAQFVKNMAIEVWSVQKAKLGIQTLDPNLARTVLSSMSTLWVMGLKEEFNQAKRWVEANLTLDKVDQLLDVSDIVTDFIGSLLSCYALTNESFFLDKAEQIAKLLESAYQTGSGIPYKEINPKHQTTSGESHRLTSVGGQYLEYKYLADLANNNRIDSRNSKIRQILNYSSKSSKGLYMTYVYVHSGNWSSSISTLGEEGRQFYASLGKSYLQSDGIDLQALEMFNLAIDAAEAAQMLPISSHSRLLYARFSNARNDNTFMQYQACYLGALFSLVGAHLDKFDAVRSRRYSRMAEELTETCHFASNCTKTGLAPAKFYFNNNGADGEAITDGRGKDAGNWLNSELAESYFVLWRNTGKAKYGDYAWEMVQAIYKHARTSNGNYFAVKDVNQIPTKEVNKDLPANFIGGTLKYLYLTFVDRSILSLNQWIFSTVGQPLPIRCKHSAYTSTLVSVDKSYYQRKCSQSFAQMLNQNVPICRHCS